MEKDADDLKDILEAQTKEKYSVKSYAALTDQLFSYITIKRGSVPVALIFEETACHGYTELYVSSGTYFRVSTCGGMSSYYTCTPYVNVHVHAHVHM
jgi:hypothetical protein